MVFRTILSSLVVLASRCFQSPTVGRPRAKAFPLLFQIFQNIGILTLDAKLAWEALELHVVPEKPTYNNPFGLLDSVGEYSNLSQSLWPKSPAKAKKRQRHGKHDSNDQNMLTVYVSPPFPWFLVHLKKAVLLTALSCFREQYTHDTARAGSIAVLCFNLCHGLCHGFVSVKVELRKQQIWVEMKHGIPQMKPHTWSFLST